MTRSLSIRRRAPRRLAHCLLGATLLTQGLAPAVAQDGRYRLGPEDRVRIRVTEWRSARSEAYVWEALSGEYSVDASGRLSVPLVGTIEVGGRTTDDVAVAIGEQLQRRVGLVQRPDAAVEVAEFRPIYVVGQVDKPGAYPYRPQLTVLQALSLAGGLYRMQAETGRFERETINAQGDLRELQAERLALVARRARLEAEKNGETAVAFPPELTGVKPGSAGSDMVREETALFEARRDTLRSQITALTQAKALLETEIQSLQAKIATQDRQITLARKELDNINGLFERGLAASQRQLSLEQIVAQLEGSKLDSQVALSRARQDISRSDRTMIDLRTQQQNSVLTDLRETQMRLGKAQQKIETSRDLLAETEASAPQLGRSGQPRARREPEYTIVRTGAEGAKDIKAGETTAIQPGDVLKVVVPRARDEETSSPAAPSRRTDGSTAEVR